jgi:hypothetical protein
MVYLNPLGWPWDVADEQTRVGFMDHPLLP